MCEPVGYWDDPFYTLCLPCLYKCEACDTDLSLCDRCAPRFALPTCRECVKGFTGVDCDTCALGYTSTDCDQCDSGYYDSSNGGDF